MLWNRKNIATAISTINLTFSYRHSRLMKKLKIIAAAFLLFSLENGFAQNSTDTTTTVVLEPIVTADTIEYINTVDGYAVQNRLAQLQQTIPLPYNQTIHGFIDFFVFRKPSYTKLMLERQQMYFPMFENTLARYNMPQELKYLSVVESGLNPKAISRAKAAGLWQFMRVTGKEFGLNVDTYIDDRMHIEKSTDAACRYLKQLHSIFGDWHLALAAYNTGPGNVRRAIKKSGGVYDFWTIYRFLPKETRSYVPQFVALAYMMNHANSHGIYGENFEQLIPSNPIMINGFFDISTLANLTGMSLDDIQKLNPQIQKDILPSSTRDFELKLPAAQFGNLMANRQMIMDSAMKPRTIVMAMEEVIVDGVLYRNGVRVRGADLKKFEANQNGNDVVEDLDTQPLAKKNQPKVKEVVTDRVLTKTKTYVVKKGDNLTQIANKFDVSVDEIADWNNLAGSSVRSGQKLQIFTDGQINESGRIAKDDAEEILISKKVRKKTYAVRRGDNLGEIADKFNVDVYDLKKWNGLTSTKIKAGQKLKIFSDEVETTSTKLAKRNSETKQGSKKVHIVGSGDTLWSIAQQYGGLSIDKLKQINGLKGNTVRAGQKIKLS